MVSVAAVSCHLRKASIRSHVFRNLSFSRMLDMGGAPSSINSLDKARRIDTSKNCKVQAVCFDFDILTRSISDDGPDGISKGKEEDGNGSHAERKQVLGDVKPDMSMIQHVASLLNVSLDSGSDAKGRKNMDVDDDDLSLLTGEARKAKVESSENSPSNTGIGSDVRAKYADRLAAKGLHGGIATVERAKKQVEETLRKGDAGGHLEARKMVASDPAGGQKWMASTGTGRLLQYLTQRSMRIILLPKPSNEKNELVGKRMDDLVSQLKGVEITKSIKDGSMDLKMIIDEVLDTLKLNPIHVMLVSDRDDYVRAAKEEGMVTVRIRPKNTPRGNVSAHYMVTTVEDVQEVVNEINGISFSAVLKG